MFFKFLAPRVNLRPSLPFNYCSETYKKMGDNLSREDMHVSFLF